jgi:hypothetical protein
LDFFRLAVELQQKYRRPGMGIHNALQTNGTTLSEEWCRFLRKAFFTHINQPMRIMAAELRSERPPVTIMLFLAREEAQLQRRFARARRNEPWPCG